MQDHAPLAQAPVAQPARLKRRADFLRAAAGKRFHSAAFVLQAVDRPRAAPQAEAQAHVEAAAHVEAEEPAGGPLPATSAPRFGFTVTKKVGNAVKRNRIRRRLKEALRTAGALPARPGCDYVVIARVEALRLAFPALQEDLLRALARIDGRPAKGGHAGRRKKV